MTDRSDYLVSTEWLANHLEAPDVVIVDASWHMPDANRSGQAEYLEQRIPGAIFFDIDEIADLTAEFPHTLPPSEKFASRMRKLGIGDGKRIVVYDSHGLFSAARVWWMFRYFGHEDVVILDGGLKKWIAESRPITDGPPRKQQERHFTARVQALMASDTADVLSAVTKGDAQVADARSPGRFTGKEKEPRPGVRSGHMPNARNVHYATLLNDDGTVKSADDIEAAFKAAKVDLNKPVITSCGSGVTAAILSLGLELVGHNSHMLYDGSWTEWGSTPALPVETGET